MAQRMGRRGFLAALGASGVVAAAVKPAQAQYQGLQGGGSVDAPVNVQARDLGNGRGAALVQMRDRTLEAQFDGMRVTLITTYTDFRSKGTMRFETEFSREQRLVGYWARNVDRVASNIASQNPNMRGFAPQQLGQLAETVLMDTLYLGKIANDAYYQVNRTNPYGRPEYGVQICAIPEGAPLQNLDYFFHSGNQGPPKFHSQGVNQGVCDAPRPGFGGLGRMFPGYRPY